VIHPITPTSTRCLSAWQPNPGRGSTYQRGNPVQTTGTTSPKDIRMSRNYYQLPNKDPATLLAKHDNYGPEDAANLKAQIADLKQVIISLRAQLADMHEQMNRWQSRADRVSLTAPY
jgi:hypothetical protein